MKSLTLLDVLRYDNQNFFLFMCVGVCAYLMCRCKLKWEFFFLLKVQLIVIGLVIIVEAIKQSKIRKYL